MKISEAITKANALRDNLLTDEQKAAWLRDLDGQIADFMRLSRDHPRHHHHHHHHPYIIREIPPEGHEPPAPPEPPKVWPFDNVWPEEDADLLMPFPHEDVYVTYLVAQIDYYNQESDLFANDMAIYNAAMSEARAWWQREHVPPKFGPAKVW